jgi:hypothetical protein
MFNQLISFLTHSKIPTNWNEINTENELSDNISLLHTTNRLKRSESRMLLKVFKDLSRERIKITSNIFKIENGTNRRREERRSKSASSTSIMRNNDMIKRVSFDHSLEDFNDLKYNTNNSSRSNRSNF